MPARTTGPKKKPPAVAAPARRVAERSDFDIPSWAIGLFMQVQTLRAGMQDHPSPPRLFHYTDANGLLGIIQSQTMWATHVDYLNDASEVQYGQRLVVEMLAAYEAESKLEATRAILARTRDTFGLVTSTDLYVLCFCEQGDLLSQWRGYASGGAGYAIGIDPERLVAKRESMGSFFFGKVEYRPR